MTVFKFTAWVKDAKEKESVTEYIMENKDSMCFSTENYIMTTLTNLEENESISFNSDKKQLELELIGANVSLLGQRLEINLIRMDENQCFIIFKHIILEFIPFDVLMSSSSSKKKSSEK